MSEKIVSDFTNRVCKTALSAASGLCLLASLLGCAVADLGAADQPGEPLRPAAVICIDPATGRQSRLPLAMGQNEDCPAGHRKFIAFQVEQSPGADPLPFEPQEQKQDAEVGDAPMDQP